MALNYFLYRGVRPEPFAFVRAHSHPAKWRHLIAMGLIFRRLAEIRVRPADEHVVALDPRHDADVALAAAPDRHLHSQLNLWFFFAPLHR
jgi:hypothetical protein